MSASRPFALGTRTAELEWTGVHLRDGVPLRNTVTLSPTRTQIVLPLSPFFRVSMLTWGDVLGAAGHAAAVRRCAAGAAEVAEGLAVRPAAACG
jgi:hypothetical protein